SLFFAGDAVSWDDYATHCARLIGRVEKEQFVRRDQGGEQAVCGHAEAGHAAGSGREFGQLGEYTRCKEAIFRARAVALELQRPAPAYFGVHAEQRLYNRLVRLD